MNIVAPLIPIAVTALDSVVRSLGDVFAGDNDFNRWLQAASHNSEHSAAETSAQVVRSAPEQSQRGQQAQRDVMRQQYEALRELAHQQLKQRFEELGIDVSEPAVLTVDSNGRFLEAGGHWDRVAIEELLRVDAGLRNQLSQLLQLGNSLSSAGPGGQNDPAATSRLVVGEQEIFFQVV